ncbi:MAG: hypothetical protein ACYCV5_08795 [Acidimicrobiales bacterium]
MLLDFGTVVVVVEDGTVVVVEDGTVVVVVEGGTVVVVVVVDGVPVEPISAGNDQAAVMQDAGWKPTAMSTPGFPATE